MKTKEKTIAESQRTTLEKLEHRINLGIKNTAQNMASILLSLKDIRDNKYYLLRNCKSLRDYIIKMDYMKRLNLHISNIFIKLQVIDYGIKHNLEYQDIQNIGEAKVKLLVQTDKEIGKDITVEDLKKKKLIELEYDFRKSGNAELENVSSLTTCLDYTPIQISHSDVKEIVINDREQEITVIICKDYFDKYLMRLKEVDKVRFVE